jgi:hypothetical protein
MKKTITLLLAISLFSTIIFAQSKNVENVTQKLLQYSNENVVEKVFLHLDKPYYAVGEHIWFKAYLVDGVKHHADSLSAVLYVDLLENGKDKIVKNGKFRLIDGLAEGELSIPDTLMEGKYTIRAYTNWMRNFSPDFFFHQTFEVIGGRQIGMGKPIASTPTFDLQFMPESGHLVDGIQTKIAFKAIDEQGKGTNIQGSIVTSAGDTLGKIASENLGMGLFRLRPKFGLGYKIIAKNKQGIVKIFDLPKVNEFGHVLSVDNFESKDYINLSIRSKSASYGKKMTIVAQTRGIVAYTGNFISGETKIIQNVQRNILQDGIVQLTVFDENGIPICERLVYNTSPKAFNIKLTPNKSTFKKREKISLEFEVTDTDGKPINEAFLSLAVTDGNQVLDAANGQNIYSYFFLNSDLKGQIEEPAYYFDAKNDKAPKHLDLLLMTQGWTRFVWQDVLENKKFTYPYFPEPGITISGQAYKSNKRKVNKSLQISGYVSNAIDKQMTMTETSVDGKFALYGLDFTDSADLMLNAFISKKDNDYITVLDSEEWQKAENLNCASIFSLQNNDNQTDEYIRNATMNLAMEKGSFFTELQAVDIKAKKEKKVDQRRPYGEKFIRTVKVDNQSVGGLSVLEYLQGRVPGVEVKCDYTGKGCRVRIRGNASMSGNNEPTFLLDGVPVEQFTIQSMSLNDIEMIDVLSGAATMIYANRGATGVINVLSKRGNPNPEKFEADGVKVHRVKGFDVLKEFYMPKYDMLNPPADHDVRTTVYWNPMIKVTKGWSKVEFFNTDEPTIINCFIQGTNGKGVMGMGKTSYKVE